MARMKRLPARETVQSVIVATDGRWLVVLAHAPAQSSTPWVGVWRKMRAAGAEPVQGGAWLLPRTPYRGSLARECLAEAVRRGGGGHVFVAERVSAAEPSGAAATPPSPERAAARGRQTFGVHA